MELKNICPFPPTDYTGRQKNSLPSISLDSNGKVKLIFNSSFFDNIFFYSSVQNQSSQLSEKIANKQNELKMCVFIVEHCLYLLWAHLEFYMSKAIPVNTMQYNNATVSGDYMDMNWRITSDDISLLKKALISVLNETFSNKLQETNLVRNYGFEVSDGL